jgi:hypothetical protein
MIMVPASSSSARREDDKDGLLATIGTGRFMDRFITQTRTKVLL